MMSKLIMRLLAAAGCGLSVSQGWAQVVEPLPVSEPLNDPAVAAAFPTQAEAPTLALDFKFAPNWDNDLLKSDGDRLSDFQTTSVSLNYRSSLFGPGGKNSTIVFTGSFGLKGDTDFDDDASETPTAFTMDGKLNWNRGFRRISPFVSYNLEAGFDDYFKDYKATDQTVSFGSDIQFLGRVRCRDFENPNKPGDCNGTPVFKLALVPSLDRTFSSKGVNKRWTPRVKLKAEGGFDWGLGWEVSGSVEYRSYDQINPDTNTDKEWRYIVFGSLDIAKLIEPAGRFLKEFKLGARWNGVERLDGADKSTLSVVPVIRISVPIGG